MAGLNNDKKEIDKGYIKSERGDTDSEKDVSNIETHMWLALYQYDR